MIVILRRYFYLKNGLTFYLCIPSILLIDESENIFRLLVHKVVLFGHIVVVAGASASAVVVVENESSEKYYNKSFIKLTVSCTCYRLYLHM